MTSQNNLDQTEWKAEHENILAEWGDKAMCYKWLHQKSNQKFSRLNALFTIPVIVISTITGTANFAQDKFSGSTREMVVVIIGSFNILAGIIQTIHQFLKISEYNEAHRVSCIAWDKFYRNIKVELAKSPKERIPVSQMLKLCKEEFDRLTETSPNIPEEMVGLFLKSGKKNLETFGKISKPEICGDLVSTNTFRYIEKIPINLPKAPVSNESVQKSVQQGIVRKFVEDFTEIRGRPPTIQEIQDNLQEENLNLSAKTIQTLLTTRNTLVSAQNNLEETRNQLETNIDIVLADQTDLTEPTEPTDMTTSHNDPPDAEAIEMKIS